MPIPFSCSECGFKSQVKDQLQGKKLKCPKCQAINTVGAKKKATAKAGGASDDPFDNLLNMNLDAIEEESLGQVGEKGYLDEEERPKKKKRRKKATEPQPKMSSGALAGLVLSLVAALGIVGVGGYMFLPGMFIAKKVEPPKEFDRFHHLYGEFYIDIPKDEGWVIEESPNKPGVPEWIKMENGPVRIEVRFDDSGTLVANATEGGMNIVEASQNFAAMGGRTMERNNSDPAIVRSLHDSAAKKYVNYRNFDDGPTKDFDMPYGDARISTCSFTEGIASNMKAIRISVYNSAKAWSIFCVAPEASFDQLKPTFERIVQSMEGVQPKFD